MTQKLHEETWNAASNRCCQSVQALCQWFSNCGTRTTSGTRGLFRWYASSFPVILKSFVNSFLCYNSFVSYADVANSFICYITLKYILSKLRSSETRGVHSNIKKTSSGTRSQKVWEPLLYAVGLILCSKIADVHGIEIDDVLTWKFVYFQKIFRFLLHNTRDVTRG